MSLMWEVGNGGGDRLMSVLYADLRRMVRGVMASEGQRLAAAAQQVRLVLNDYARRRSGTKNGAPLKIALADAVFGGPGTAYDFAAVDRLLKQLAGKDAALARILEMYCFGGMSDREMALVEHTSTAKAKRDRELAGSWLAQAAQAGLESVRLLKIGNELSKYK